MWKGLYWNNPFVLALWASFIALARVGARRTWPWKSIVAPGGLALHTALSTVLSLTHIVSLCRLPAVSHLFSALSHLTHQGLATQVEQTFIFLRFTLCILTNPLPATRVDPLQLPAPLISMVTEDTTIIQILPQRVGLYNQVFLG